MVNVPQKRHVRSILHTCFRGSLSGCEDLLTLYSCICCLRRGENKTHACGHAVRLAVLFMKNILLHAQGAALAETGRPFPVVLFSHGLAGTRNTYSLFCSELASRGYVVLALEHACGTASTCHLAGSGSDMHPIVLCVLR